MALFCTQNIKNSCSVVMEEEEGEIEITLGTKEDNVEECSFHKWSKLFHDLPHSITSTIIPLCGKFLEYLKEDGVKFPTSVDPQHGSEDVESFPEVEKGVKEFLRSCEDGVFVKMNWSAPKDCRWVFFEPDLKCKTVKDVWMLLKSSDFMMHDIERSKSIPKFLVLKKWIYIDFSLEFRCFVKNNELVGISQRDISKYFPFLKTMKKEIWDTISRFWNRFIKTKFRISDYTFDVFWDMKDRQKDKVILLDFNVFGPPTHPLMFYDWRYFTRESEEIRELLEVKVIESDSDQRLKPTPVSGLPTDVSDPDTFKQMQKEFEKFNKENE